MCLLLSSHKQNTPLQVSLLKSVKKSMHDSVGLSSVYGDMGQAGGENPHLCHLECPCFSKAAVGRE